MVEAGKWIRLRTTYPGGSEKIKRGVYVGMERSMGSCLSKLVNVDGGPV